MLPVALLGGCALLTDLDGLSGGADPADGGGGGGQVDGAPTVDGGAQVSDGGSRDGSSSSDATRDDGRAKYEFRDEFTRQDTASGLGGNGWRERSPAFRIDEGTALRLNASPGAANYRTAIATRPDAESVLDVEVRVDVIFLSSVTSSFPQVHARVQPSSLATGAGLESYIFFRNANFPEGKTFTIARQRGDGIFETLKDFNATEAPAATTVMRLRLRVKGTSPVELDATVEIKEAGNWLEIGSEKVTDSTSSRIQTPGVVGFSGGGEGSDTFAYDDFEAKEL